VLRRRIERGWIQEKIMARKKGCRVKVCKCGTQVVGMPGRTKKCQHCGKKVTMPSKRKKK